MNIGLRSSKLLTVSLVAGHLILGVALWPLHLPLAGKIAATFILAASCVFYVRRDALLAARNSIVSARIEADGACRIELKFGEAQECFLLDSSFVTPSLTILNLKVQGKRRARHVAILPDSLPPDDFRRLRVWLRWKCAKKGLRTEGLRIA
ncbi:MAG: protein YgfX [Burkholderiales bacterium]